LSKNRKIHSTHDQDKYSNLSHIFCPPRNKAFCVEKWSRSRRLNALSSGRFFEAAMIFIIESNFKKIGCRRRSAWQNPNGPRKIRDEQERIAVLRYLNTAVFLGDVPNVAEELPQICLPQA